MFQNFRGLARQKPHWPLLSRHDCAGSMREGSASLKHGPPTSIKVPAMSSHSTGYTKAQIFLHWVTAALVIFQLVLR